MMKSNTATTVATINVLVDRLVEKLVVHLVRFIVELDNCKGSVGAVSENTEGVSGRRRC